MKEKLVTVVMPVYNAAAFLCEAVDSVLAQTYEYFELIMVDDCSTDNSLEIARSYEQKDPRVRVFCMEKNSGVANVRNRGIREARGEYVALLDSDDVWVADKLERQVKSLEASHAQIAYCSYDFIDEHSQPIKRPFIVPETTNYKKMLSSCVISCSTAMIETELLKAHPFNAQFCHEDYVLWMELLAIPVSTVGDQKVLAHYRQVTGSRSNNKGNSAKKRWITYRKALGLGFFPSVIAFSQYAVKGVLKYYAPMKKKEEK